MLQPLFQKIKVKRALYAQIAVVALAFIAMASVSFFFMGNIVRGNLVRNANSVLDIAETRISSRLEEFEAKILGFATMIQSMVQKGDSLFVLQEYVHGVSSFASLDEGNITGIRSFYGYMEYLPGGPVVLFSPDTPLPKGFEPKKAAWYKAAVAAQGRLVQTTPYINRAGEFLYTYARAIQDEEGRRLGVVWMNVTISPLGEEIVKTALNQGGYGILVNQYLLTMFHPNKAFVGRNIKDPTIPISMYANDLKNGRTVFERPVSSYMEEESVVFFRTLPNGWFLGLVSPKEQYYSSMTSMGYLLSALGLGFAALVIGILLRIDLARAKSDDESRNKSMFLANMSHEIRTPINAIVGMTTIGRAAATVERKDYCFSKIDNASKHLLGVVNDILDISKIEANKIELSPTNFIFEKMLQQVVNVVNFRVDEKRQKLSVYIDKSIPKVLFADDQRFAQVITNLLSNAVKFTPEEGAISLKTSFLGEDDGLCSIKIEVADSGIGISPEQQAKLFQSFSQAESSTTRKFGGTGLGLAISKSIVELMGGQVWVESALGRGATFAFTVKVARGEETRFDLYRHGINWDTVRILAVDDDPDILSYFQEIIAGFGAKCEVAENAAEALKLIEKDGPFDIYFVDLRMPGEDGISLTRAIRARKDNGHAVVIMISSSELSAAEEEAKRAGIDKFLLKPLFPSSIVDVISECIGVGQVEVDEAPKNIKGIFSGRNLLFAEDNEINREILLALLEDTELGIHCAENGREAVEMFAAAPSKYDMVFMDVQMPEMDGYEATRQIRALPLPGAKEIPIVAMTANVFREDIEAALKAGMNSHLSKPLDVDAVINTLYQYLR